MARILRFPAREKSPFGDPPIRSTGRTSFDLLVHRLGVLRQALVRMLQDSMSENRAHGATEVARALVNGFNGVEQAARVLIEPVYREPTEAYAHGIALGLWYAGRPELIRDFPAQTVRHLDTLPWNFRGQMLALTKD